MKQKTLEDRFETLGFIPGNYLGSMCTDCLIDPSLVVSIETEDEERVFVTMKGRSEQFFTTFGFEAVKRIVGLTVSPQEHLFQGIHNYTIISYGSNFVSSSEYHKGKAIVVAGRCDLIPVLGWSEEEGSISLKLPTGEIIPLSAQETQKFITWLESRKSDLGGSL